MAKKVTVTITSDTTGFRTGLRDAETGLSGFSSKLQATGKQTMLFGAGLTAGITAPALFAAKQVFDAASDMQESMGKVNVVFGKSTEAVVKWSESSAKNMGISQQAALEAAGTYGNLFQAFGIGQKPAEEMSTTLVQLASDLASFNNTSTDEAILALRSGLSGETEPLKRYGIALSDVRLKQEAVSLGLIKSTKDALDPAAKSQAAYSLIMKDSTLAQGDFARTSGGAANQQRILAAQFQNTKASLGEALIPIATKLFGVVGKIVSGFNELSPKMQQMILIGIGLAASIGPIVTIVGALITGIGLLLTPVGLVVGGIALLAAGFAFLYTKSEPLRNAVDGLKNAFKDFNLDDLGGSLKNVAANLSGVFGTALDEVGKIFEKIDWKKAGETVIDGLDTIKDTIFEALSGIDFGGLALKLGETIGKAFAGIGKLITNIDWKEVFTLIFDTIGDVAKLLAGVDWGKVATGIGKVLLGILKLSVIDLPKGLFNLFKGLFEAVGELFKDVDWGEVATTLGKAQLKLFKLVFFELPKKLFELQFEAIKKAWDFLKDVDWGEVAGTIKDAYLGLLETIWLELPPKIGAFVFKGIKGAFDWVIDSGGDLLGKIGTFFKDLPKKIGEFFTGAKTWLADAGKDIIDGLLDGAGKVLGKIGKFFVDKLPGFIKEPFKKALGISSPSKIFRADGENIIDSFIMGAESKTSKLAQKMRQVAGLVTLPVNTATQPAAGGQQIILNVQMLEPTFENARKLKAMLDDLQRVGGR